MRVTKESGERWCVLPHLGVALFLEVGTTTPYTGVLYSHSQRANHFLLQHPYAP